MFYKPYFIILENKVAEQDQGTYEYYYYYPPAVTVKWQKQFTRSILLNWLTLLSQWLKNEFNYYTVWNIKIDKRFT